MEKSTHLNSNMMKNKKEWLTRSNLTTAVMAIILVILIVSPGAKSLFMQGLMKIGLFQPDVPEQTLANAAPVTSNGNSVQFQDAQGQIIDLASLKGKVVFINFWATWCPPCIAEMPSINQLYEQNKSNKNIVFLMVDMDADLNKSQKFMDRRKFSLKAIQPASQIPAEFFTGSLPTTVLLNKNGEIAFRHEGGADYANAEFQKYMQTLASN